MEYIFESLAQAFNLLFSLDRGVIRIIWTSVWVSGTSVILATLFSLPVAFIIAASQFRGKKPLVTILNTLMALPTVVVGLLVYSFLCRRGPFGNLDLLYTPYAMIIGQFILASPIITALTISAVTGADKRIQKTALTLGATKFQSLFVLASEIRIEVLAAVITGFGRIFAEVGVSMMLGGNIKNYTRNITTAIAFETAKGEFSLGLALGIVLLLCAFLINIVFQLIIRTRDEAV